MSKDYNKLAKEVHAENVAKGFDNDKSGNDMMLLLIVSELMEMIEADRIDKHANIGVFESPSFKHITFKMRFEELIKDTTFDESADVILRMLDYAGWQGINLDKPKHYIGNDYFMTARKGAVIKDFVKVLLNGTEPFNQIFHDFIFYFSEVLRIDIHKHIELKRKYNKLRPIRNGKNY